MFSNIHFTTYNMPTPITVDSFHKQLHNTSQNVNIPADLKTLEPTTDRGKTVFSIGGKVKIFSMPFVSDFAIHNLYHMENYSIFYSDSNFFTKRSDYASYLILYTYEGSGTLTYNKQTYQLHSGDGFVIDCQKPHYYKTKGPYWKHSVLHLNGPLLSAFHRQYMTTGSPVFNQKITETYQTQLEKLLSIYSSSLSNRDWLAADCISSILTNLLETASALSKPTAAIEERIGYLVRYMESNFTLPLSLDFLAEFAGISKYHLAREFKKYIGYSPNNYLICLRIEHAKTLLTSTSFPANKIAHMTGFHSFNNFNNLFKKKMNMTPGEFRNLH